MSDYSAISKVTTMQDLTVALRDLTTAEEKINESIRAINYGLSVYQVVAWLYVDDGQRYVDSRENADGRMFFTAFIVAATLDDAKHMFVSTRRYDSWRFVDDKCFVVAEKALVSPSVLSYDSIFFEFDEIPEDNDG